MLVDPEKKQQFVMYGGHFGKTVSSNGRQEACAAEKWSCCLLKAGFKYCPAA